MSDYYKQATQEVSAALLAYLRCVSDSGASGYKHLPTADQFFARIAARADQLREEGMAASIANIAAVGRSRPVIEFK